MSEGRKLGESRGVVRTLQLAQEVQDGCPLVFRQGWVSGDDGTVSFDLACGAGLGNSMLVLQVERKEDGLVVWEHFDITDLARQWVGQVRAGWAELAAAHDAGEHVTSAAGCPTCEGVV